ncbi:MAG TPA: NUDIX domain-containing protein [Kineosporiaceae bacterium]
MTDAPPPPPVDLRTLLAAHRPATDGEAADLSAVHDLLEGSPDPWRRATPLHLTASAIIVHPGTVRLLLRWHARQRSWLHVGGHADPGETDPLRVAVREAVEETGLHDVTPWPDPRLLHVAVVGVPASTTEPEHRHADLRFVLATSSPDAARPEKPEAPVRWVSFDEARELTASPSLQQALDLLEPLLR